MRVEVVGDGDRVEEDVEAAGEPLERSLLAREREFVGAEPLRVGLLRPDRLSIVTSAPIAEASFTAMCPRPPSPTTPTRSPGLQFHWRSGEKVVIPAQRSGAAAARSRPEGTLRTKRSLTTIRVE
jgi:hypothetical protein